MENNNGLLKDKEWADCDGKPLIITGFSPLAGSCVINGIVESPDTETPYASVNFQVVDEDGGEHLGFITHRDDFKHLWEAFEENSAPGEKGLVVAYWTASHYKFKIIQIISNLMIKFIGGAPFPKLVVACIQDIHLFNFFPLDLVPDTSVEVSLKVLHPRKIWTHEVVK